MLTSYTVPAQYQNQEPGTTYCSSKFHQLYSCVSVCVCVCVHAHKSVGSIAQLCEICHMYSLG